MPCGTMWTSWSGWPIVRGPIERFRCYLAGDHDVTDENRAQYRELAVAGLMIGGSSFAGRDESVYHVTKEGFERKTEILACAKVAS